MDPTDVIARQGIAGPMVRVRQDLAWLMVDTEWKFVSVAGDEFPTVSEAALFDCRRHSIIIVHPGAIGCLRCRVLH